MIVVRTTDEVDEVLNKCVEASDEGITAYYGMSYEDGVRAGIEWLTDQEADPVF